MSQMIAWFRANRGFFMPGGLGLLNAVLAGLWFAVFTPQIDSLSLDLRRLRAANTSLRSQVDANSLALETIDENRERYNILNKHGFIDPQNRLGATKLMERLRETHGLTSIYYEVSPEVLNDSRELEASGFFLVSTKIIVTMRGLFDADILEFTQSIIDDFPGQIRPISFSMEKIGAPTEDNLSRLREGKLVEIIGGVLTFEWNTLRPIQQETSG